MMGRRGGVFINFWDLNKIESLLFIVKIVGILQGGILIYHAIKGCCVRIVDET